ncbi:GRIP and coiled-coil domain-containing protein 2-like [Punica granatum]|uniref:Uncharacterized protein n=2 Tax=Punica granatum TaxID=22663 RepID=A0A218X1C2_PUNGR|nr:GRIP and coiled-coil domain-containing protein 2-like [Punica granatum]OWM78618.1 hypothetical protein CDL15_Pgr002789 [Punica granatum]PKI35058.1 hypothetical protein CRG98_044573 [Punica granatum]
MAVGGYHIKGSSGGGQRERGRPYGLMLLLAFGAALLGVMALHKLRERRIHHLLLKDKDRELFSLHLLLQKERDNTKEIRKKAEEMRAKIYSVRTQKMELDSRVLEMQSTISSLKDEQRTMELALEEKQDEIKLLREKEMERGKTDLRESYLKEILNQKEIEIADLKRQPQSLKVSMRGSETRKEEIDKLEKREESGQRHGSSENSTVARGVEETERKLGGTVSVEKEKSQDQGNVTEEGPVQGEATRESNSFEGAVMNRVEQGTGNDLYVITTGNGAAMDVVVEGKAELKKLEEGEKSEHPGNSTGHLSSTVQRKLGDEHRSRSKGKRWRALARHRRLESKRNSVTMKHRRFIEDAGKEEKHSRVNTAKEQNRDMNMRRTNELDQEGGVIKFSQDFNGNNLVRKEDSDGGNRLETGGEGEESTKQDRDGLESGGSGNENPKEDQYGLQSGGKGEESPEEGKELKTMGDLGNQFIEEVPKNRGMETEARNPVNGGENGVAEVEIKELGNQEGDAAAENISEDANSKEAGAREEEVPNDPEEEVREADVEDPQESEKDTASRDFFKVDAPEVEEHEDEYKEET